jgi:hypothetical protein
MNCTFFLFKQLFCCVRRVCPGDRKPRKSNIPKQILPWFWVGAELEDRVESITDIVNQYVEYGTVITPEYLSGLTQYNAIRWIYLDALTLEEKEFPPEGILIDYVARD